MFGNEHNAQKTSRGWPWGFSSKYGCDSLLIVMLSPCFNIQKLQNCLWTGLTQCWESTLDQRHYQMPLNAPACRWWRYDSAVHLLKAGTDVQWFLFRVRVGTEANQLTVNKWSPSFYRAAERKPECHSTSSSHHTHTVARIHATKKWWGGDWLRSY